MFSFLKVQRFFISSKRIPSTLKDSYSREIKSMQISFSIFFVNFELSVSAMLIIRYDQSKRKSTNKARECSLDFHLAFILWERLHYCIFTLCCMAIIKARAKINSLIRVKSATNVSTVSILTFLSGWRMYSWMNMRRAREKFPHLVFSFPFISWYFLYNLP